MKCTKIFHLVLSAALLGGCFDLPAESASRKKDSSLLIHPSTTLTLSGKEARHQLVLTHVSGEEKTEDVTRKARYKISPSGIAQIDERGVVSVQGNGEATLTATHEGRSVRLKIKAGRATEQRPVHFVNQVVPILTKAGCNGGGCHGKSGGQNGFRLSLLGFEPQEDYEYLVKESRGRRWFASAPERSLLLQKATAALPHGGGKRLEEKSADYQLLTRWISQGMPYGKETDPRVISISVYPPERIVRVKGTQQLQVTAQYSDGNEEDVTASAVYEVNDKTLAECDTHGLVRFGDRAGDAAVMVRYQSQVGIFRGTVPKGAMITQMPPEKNFVDTLIFKKLRQVGMPPSEVCNDETFIRRVTLDIAGRLPTVEETEAFVKNQDLAKRAQWVDRLLESRDYAEFFANKWSALLRNRRINDSYIRGNFAFFDWISDSFYANKPYDQFVRDILTASGDPNLNPPVVWYRQVRDSKVQLEDTAQLFLATRLQCAQCHHHPYEKWSQEDYYGFAAYFSRLGRKAGDRPGEEIVFHKRGSAQAVNTRTQKPVKPAGLGAAPLPLALEADPRAHLADWMTSAENPFFARALVNRYWKHFFNKGLVDPEDDMRATNPASHPDLLDALAKRFVESGYDLKQLIRTLCTSTTYQLSSAPNAHNSEDRYYFSRYYPRRLPAEVLLDSIDSITGVPTKYPGLPPETRAVQLPDNSFNAQLNFLQLFGRPEASSSCECERTQDASLAQSLHLLNSREIQEKLQSESGRPAQMAAANQAEAQTLNELYQLAFSRRPTASEAQLAESFVANSVQTKAGVDPVKARRVAYEDLVWTLMSTKEFLFNH